MPTSFDNTNRLHEPLEMSVHAVSAEEMPTFSKMELTEMLQRKQCRSALRILAQRTKDIQTMLLHIMLCV